MLDPAAGRLEFISQVPATERWAVDEVSYAAAEDAAGVRMVVSDIMSADLPEGYFDGVWVSNFLEHLPTQNAIAAFLEKMHSCLATGGRIAIMGPNFRYTRREYFDCADHTLALTHVAIQEHLYAAGFETTRTIPRLLPYSFRGILPPSARLTRRYLQFPPVWRLLGKQFFVVGTKSS